VSAPCAVLVASNHGEIVGGGEISLLGLLEGLDRTRWAPTVVVPAEGPVAARCRALGLPIFVIPWPTLRRPGPAAVRSVLALRRLARATGARLVHANGSRVMAYAGLAGWWAGLPVIWHVRVADRDLFLDRPLAALARAIIVNSRAVARRLDWAPLKVRCIPNGVDLTRVSPRQASPALRASLGLPEGAPVVASVGRFVAFKGYSHLLEAAHLVHQSVPAAHWLLVGDGELRGKLESHCRRLGLEPWVRFTGWREDVPDLLALCDVFVLPSLGEHFGRVLIEAMAMARAVVATDAGGVPEIVIHGETGLLVPPGEPKSLAEAVLGLLEDPARAARLGAAGRRRAEGSFSLTRHVAAVEALYAELAGTDDGDVERSLRRTT
jgi:glycosyltransferase involved in cell wall biosynthesis